MADDSSSILSEEEADAIVAAEINAELHQKAQRQEELLEVPALREHKIEREGEMILFRRVPPPPSQPAAARTVQEKRSPASAASVQRHSQETQTLFITIVDSETSEIRSPEHDGFSATLRTGFEGLPPIVSIEADERLYSIFSIVRHLETPDASSQTSALEQGSPASEPLVFYSETGAPVPSAFQQAVTRLYQHYLEHQVRFEREARRAEALRRARERHATKHPPARRETIINYWPARDGAAD